MVTRLIEEKVQLPLPHGYTYMGKVDLFENMQLVDWKTSSDPDALEDRKAVGFQPECYALALRERGIVVAGFEYRVAQTPTIKLTKKETPWDYTARCIEWLKESGKRRVRAIPHPITETALEQARHWLRSVTERVVFNRTHDTWLTNDTACHTYHSQCPYLPLCKSLKYGYDTQNLLGEMYETKQVRHPELGEDSDEIITYSSASTFSLCEQRYYYDKVLAVQRKDSELAKPLFIGSMFHEGVEAALHGEDVAVRIQQYVKAFPALGKALRAQHESVAKATAMALVAKEKWID